MSLHSKGDGSRYWMIVESPANWEADREREFRSLGVSKKFQRSASSIRKGDLLISYVSKVGGFADVREVESDELENADGSSHYDREFEFQLKTRSVVALERDHFVSVKPLLDDLLMTRGKANWSWVFRTSLKALEAADGRRLVSEIRKSAKARR